MISFHKLVPSSLRLYEIMKVISLIILASLGISEGFEPPISFMGRPFTGFIPKSSGQIESANPQFQFDGQLLWFDQILDHFNSTNPVTWKQRYIRNTNSATSPDGPHFLFLGGESPLSPYVFSGASWVGNFNATFWVLEHRFYGNSRPFPTQETENLQYLTSRQNLADAANFIRTMNKDLNLTNPKWITFGGSYAGALALWLRELYPDLVAGAVGSSGPIEPKLDFYEFLQFCENSIRSFDPRCAENVKVAFHNLESYMQTEEGREKLELMFNENSEYPLRQLNLTSTNIENFYIRAIGYFENAVQYNGDSKNGEIAKLCKIMDIPSPDKVVNLGLVSSNMYQLMDWDVGRESPTYSNLVEFLQDPGYQNPFQSAMRSWVWQTCNEFGFYATTDAGGSIFGSKVPENFYIDICTDVFGDEYNIDFVKNGVAKTRAQYGGRGNYTGTNVIASRGSVDPWSALALEVSDEPSVIPYLIEGGSHCSDMESPRAEDSESLKNLRLLISENIKKWIGISTIEESSPGDAGVLEHRITQPLDNFNKTDGRRWSQKFWENSNISEPNGPTFLILGGRDDTSTSLEQQITNSTLLEWAENFGARVFALLHRFFDDDRTMWPTSDLSLEDLKYLSVDQALADVANFINAANSKFDLSNSKWIIFGGGFGGSLAAWFRQKYPELTVGAVASSAPMSFEVDGFGYRQSVEKALINYDPTCGQNIASAFEAIHSKIYDDSGRRELDSLFRPIKPFSSQDTTTKDIQTFFDKILRIFDSISQDEDKISYYCDIITDDWNPPLQNLFRAVFKFSGDYIDNDYTKMIDHLRNTTSGERRNLWQNCREFGGFPTTDMGRNIFGASVSVDYYIELCTDVFGFNRTTIDASVSHMRQVFGGLTGYNATRIVFTNGASDPWTTLGFNTTVWNPNGISTLLIEGGSHCSDLNPPTTSDSEGLLNARQKIENLLDFWLD